MKNLTLLCSLEHQFPGFRPVYKQIEQCCNGSDRKRNPSFFSLYQSGGSSWKSRNRGDDEKTLDAEVDWEYRLLQGMERRPRERGECDFRDDERLVNLRTNKCTEGEKVIWRGIEKYCGKCAENGHDG